MKYFIIALYTYIHNTCEFDRVFPHWGRDLFSSAFFNIPGMCFKKMGDFWSGYISRWLSSLVDWPRYMTDSLIVPILSKNLCSVLFLFLISHWSHVCHMTMFTWPWQNKSQGEKKVKCGFIIEMSIGTGYLHCCTRFQFLHYFDAISSVSCRLFIGFRFLLVFANSGEDNPSQSAMIFP